MKTIWKFQLSITHGVQEILVPEGMKILDIQNQGGIPTLWAMVDDEEPVEARKFFMAGTGWGIAYPSYAYIGTVQIGDYVWHFFEILGEGRK